MKPRLFKTEAAMRAFVASRSGQGGAYHVLILHDDGCSPSRCTCRPWYEVRDLTVDNVVEGARLQKRWVKETAS